MAGERERRRKREGGKGKGVLGKGKKEGRVEGGKGEAGGKGRGGEFASLALEGIDAHGCHNYNMNTGTQTPCSYDRQ